MKTIRKIHQARYAPMADLVTYSALPVPGLRQIDPFLLLNHHGPQRYEPGNNGMPFGPHPHRGMETVTFILEGDILHRDNQGHESVVGAGGVQWMTAGRGLIHAEVSSPEFRRNGGDLEILQLWVNLPARHKMTDPFYKGLAAEDVPVAVFDGGKARIRVISGMINGVSGPFQPLSSVTLGLIMMQDKANLQLEIPRGDNVLLYVIKGEVYVNSTQVQALTIAEFDDEGTTINLSAGSESVVLLGHGRPYGEPVVASGPFVMNTEQEIQQAYRDYQAGKFGTL